MARTRPSTDQIRFLSQSNGSQVLDEYMEAAERGGRSLGDLLGDLFTTSGALRSDIVEFRYNASLQRLEVRPKQPAGSDPDLFWSKLSNLFRDRGDFEPSIQFENLDMVRTSNGDLWVISGLAIEPHVFDDEADLIASPSANRVFNFSGVQTLRDEVQVWHGQVDAWRAQVSADVTTTSSGVTAAQSAQAASEAARDVALTHRNSAQTAASNAATSAANALISASSAASSASVASDRSAEALAHRNQAEVFANNSLTYSKQNRNFLYFVGQL